MQQLHLLGTAFHGSLWALFSLCILHLPTNLHPFIFLLKLVKQVPGYVGIGAHGCEAQIYQLLWHWHYSM